MCIKSLRKHAYSNTLKILPPKNETFQIKNSDIFHEEYVYREHGFASGRLCFDTVVFPGNLRGGGGRGGGVQLLSQNCKNEKKIMRDLKSP